MILMRWSILTLAIMTCGLAVRAGLPAAPKKAGDPDKLWVFVGTYSTGKSKGIYRLELDQSTGKLSNPVLAAEARDPSFLAIHPNRHFLYAVNEVGDFGPDKSGAISAFALDPATGKLTFLNQQSSGGAGPCYVTVDKKGKHVLAANYGGGSICVLPIENDGRLGQASAFVQHKGSGASPDRQQSPHAHSINLDRANRFAFVADLGLDQVIVYRYDADKGTLAPNDPPSVKVPSGSGPRHFAFHPNGRFAYVINELGNTVIAFDYDARHGTLKERQIISTLPENFTGKSYTAEVVVHPSGKFLYGSNRGHNTIACFAIDPRTGELILVGHQGHEIKVPRNFVIDPTGAYLIAASQDGDRLEVFKIDQATGLLSAAGSTAEVGKPVCVRMITKVSQE